MIFAASATHLCQSAEKHMGSVESQGPRKAMIANQAPRLRSRLASHTRGERIYGEQRIYGERSASPRRVRPPGAQGAKSVWRKSYVGTPAPHLATTEPPRGSKRGCELGSARCTGAGPRLLRSRKRPRGARTIATAPRSHARGAGFVACYSRVRSLHRTQRAARGPALHP